MYCVYCNDDHDDASMTKEHVIPYALGGSDSLTIRTCARQNNDLGRDVDAPFLNLFTVRSKRFFLGLESTSGNPPTLDLSGVTWIDGKETPISYLIRGDKKDLKLSHPSVERTSQGTSEQWQISGDPTAVRRILEGKIRQQSSLGKTVTLSDGSILRVEDLDKLFEERVTVTQNPSILKQVEIDFLIPLRFFSKLALATGYLHLGEPFGRSAIGSVLRSHMSLENFGDARLRGAIWPMTDSISSALEILGSENEHTLVVMEGDPPIFVANLFGDHGALITLGDPSSSPRVRGDGGQAWRINLPSRKLIRSTIPELIGHRADSRMTDEVPTGPS